MKKQWFAMIALVILLAGCFCGCAQKNPVILKTKTATYTKEQVLAAIDLNCRKYGMTREDLYEDPGFWNQMVNDIVFEYAGAEIAKELCEGYGFTELSDAQKAAALEYVESQFNIMEKIGENPEECLEKMGFTVESYTVYAENQFYETYVQDKWAEGLELAEDPNAAFYQKLYNYTQLMWDEINARADDGTFKVDVTSLVQETNG